MAGEQVAVWFEQGRDPVDDRGLGGGVEVVPTDTYDEVVPGGDTRAGATPTG